MKSFVPILSDVFPLDGGKEADCQRVGVEIFNSAGFLVGSFFLSGNFFYIAIEGFRKSRALGFFPRDEDSPDHFRFRHLDPGLSLRFGVESFRLVGVALPSDPDLPLVRTPLANICHFTPHGFEDWFSNSLEQNWSKNSILEEGDS